MKLISHSICGSMIPSYPKTEKLWACLDGTGMFSHSELSILLIDKQRTFLNPLTYYRKKKLRYPIQGSATLGLTNQYNPGDLLLKGVPSAESSRSVRGLGKDVSGKPYPRLCNARRPRLEPGTFRSWAVRLYRLHQARPSGDLLLIKGFFFNYKV